MVVTFEKSQLLKSIDSNALQLLNILPVDETPVKLQLLKSMDFNALQLLNMPYKLLTEEKSQLQKSTDSNFLHPKNMYLNSVNLFVSPIPLKENEVKLLIYEKALSNVHTLLKLQFSKVTDDASDL